MTIKLCKCLETKGSHKVDKIIHWDRYVLKGGSWTSFSVLQCIDCGGYCGFPPRNFELALNEVSERLKIQLEYMNQGVLIV